MDTDNNAEVQKLLDDFRKKIEDTDHNIIVCNSRLTDIEHGLSPGRRFHRLSQEELLKAKESFEKKKKEFIERKERLEHSYKNIKESKAVISKEELDKIPYYEGNVAVFLNNREEHKRNTVDKAVVDLLSSVLYKRMNNPEQAYYPCCDGEVYISDFEYPHKCKDRYLCRFASYRANQGSEFRTKLVQRFRELGYTVLDTDEDFENEPSRFWKGHSEKDYIRVKVY